MTSHESDAMDLDTSPQTETNAEPVSFLPISIILITIFMIAMIGGW